MLGGGVAPVIDLEATILVVGFTLCGACLGTVSGLIPGLHANNFAMLLVGIAPAVPAPPLYVGVAMLAAGIVHSFLDVVPAMAIGVPEADMAVTALPGHRLVIEGRGPEALRLSALGSVLAVLFAVPMAIPVTLGVTLIYDQLMANVSYVLLAVVIGLIITEPTYRAMLGDVVSFGLAAGLGLVFLDQEPNAPLAAGGMLSPLFAGMFGAPVLLDAMDGGGVPTQEPPTLRTSRRAVLATAGAGSLAGAIVGYLPGVSAAIAAVAVLAIVPAAAGDRGYVIATSGVDTANAIFALFALAALDAPRSGIVVAYDDLGAPIELVVLVVATIVAGIYGYFAVIHLGDRYIGVIGALRYERVSVALLLGLALLSYLFAGLLGVGVYMLSVVVGLVPVKLGGRRVHLMGVLLGPLIVG